MDKTGAMVAALDRMILELGEVGRQEAGDDASMGRLRLTGDAMLFLLRARTLLKEKEGGRKHVHKG